MIRRLILFLMSIGYYSFTHDELGVFGVCLVGQCARLWILKRIGDVMMSPKTLYPFMIVLVAVVSVQMYDMRYANVLGDANAKTILTTGVILNHSKQGQYEFEDVRGRSWILKSEEVVDIGSAVRVLGKVQWVDLTKEQVLGVFDYDRWLKMKGYAGQISAMRVDVLSSSEANIIFGMRNRVSNQVAVVFGSSPEAGLLHGMLVGSKRGIPKEQYDGFIRSGLVHLIAVSGGNVMMVSIFLGWLLCWVPYYIRLFLIGIGIVTYGMLCGTDSSVVRAVLMGLLGLIALFAGRMIDSLRVVVIAMVAMLLWNPYYLVYDMGFVLSFAAVTGVVVMSNRRQCQRAARSTEKPSRLLRWRYGAIGNYLIPTIGATIGVLPVLLLFSGSYNLTGLLGNIVIIPLVPIIMVGGILVLVLHTIRAGEIIVSGVSWLLQSIYYMSNWINDHGYWVMTSHGGAKCLIVLLCAYMLRYMDKVVRTVT